MSCEKAMVLIAELTEAPDFQSMQKKRTIALMAAGAYNFDMSTQKRWTFSGASDEPFPEEIAKLGVEKPPLMTDEEVFSACAALVKDCEDASKSADYDEQGLWRASAITPTKCIQFVREDKATFLKPVRQPQSLRFHEREHHPYRHPHSPALRGTPCVAARRRLGLGTIKRSRTRAAHSGDPGADGSDLIPRINPLDPQFRYQAG